MTMAVDDTARPGFLRRLGLLDTSFLVIVAVVGSGIFMTPGLIAAGLPSPGLLLTVWLAGGLVTLCGALSFAGLGAMYPQAGGQYVYLCDGAGRLRSPAQAPGDAPPLPDLGISRRSPGFHRHVPGGIFEHRHLPACQVRGRCRASPGGLPRLPGLEEPWRPQPGRDDKKRFPGNRISIKMMPFEKPRSR
jgi:hypothetical protein